MYTYKQNNNRYEGRNRHSRQYHMESPIFSQESYGESDILVIMQVENFKTDVIDFVGNIIMCFDVIMSDDYQSQFINTDNITWWDQIKNVKITDKYKKNI